MSRRRAGKREWKVTIYELFESEQTSRQVLRSISDLRPNDAEIQRLCGKGFEESAERVSKLHELLLYNDKEDLQTNGQHAMDAGADGNGGAG